MIKEAKEAGNYDFVINSPFNYAPLFVAQILHFSFYILIINVLFMRKFFKVLEMLP